MKYCVLVFMLLKPWKGPLAASKKKKKLVFKNQRLVKSIKHEKTHVVLTTKELWDLEAYGHRPINRSNPNQIKAFPNLKS